jgi:YfiR/HmsC-like
MVVLCALVLLLSCPGPAWATLGSQLKAAVVFNIIKFVEWPPGVLLSNDSLLLLGVPERDPLAEALASLDGKVVQGRPLKVRKSAKIEDLKKCQVVVISEAGAAASLLNNFRGLPILTITDDLANFARSGGVINITEEDGKIKLQVNLGAATRSHLTINSQLLKLATVLGEEAK